MVFHWWKAIAQEKKGWRLPEPHTASRNCSPSTLSAFPGSSTAVPSQLRELFTAPNGVFAQREITLKPLFHKHTFHFTHRYVTLKY